MLVPRLNKIFNNVYNKYTQKQINKFISKINTVPGLGPKGDCWEWNGIKNKDNYGIISFYEKYYLTHRISYEMFTGRSPKGLLVCHKCDNPSCVNPNHLWVGTNQDNVDDMINKNRSKINYKQANEMRIMYATGKYSRRQLGNVFNISQAYVGQILLNKSLKDDNYTYIEIRKYNHKLNKEFADEIRKLYNIDKYTYADLAKIYKVGFSTIRNIIINESWNRSQ